MKSLFFVLATVMMPTLLFAQGREIKDYQANNCEFYVNGFVHSSQYYTFTTEWITSYIAVNEKVLVKNQGDEIVKVGLVANDRDGFLGKKIEPAYYAIRVDLKPRVANGHGGYRPGLPYALASFQYFIEIRRKLGQIERLWLTNSNKGNFSWPNDFAVYPQFVRTTGNLREAALKTDGEDISPIFNQRRACVK